MNHFLKIILALLFVSTTAEAQINITFSGTSASVIVPESITDVTYQVNGADVIILSTNLKSNIDEAFARRFQIMVRFNMPNAQERERLWISSFSPLCELEETIDIKQIAEDYELAGEENFVIKELEVFEIIFE